MDPYARGATGKSCALRSLRCIYDHGASAPCYAPSSRSPRPGPFGPRRYAAWAGDADARRRWGVPPREGVVEREVAFRGVVYATAKDARPRAAFGPSRALRRAELAIPSGACTPLRRCDLPWRQRRGGNGKAPARSGSNPLARLGGVKARDRPSSPPQGLGFPPRPPAPAP